MVLRQSKRKAALRRKRAAKPEPSKNVVHPGKATSKEESVSWSLRLPKSVDLALKKLAKDNGRSANKQVEMLIRKAVSQAQESAAEAVQHSDVGLSLGGIVSR